MIQVIQVKVGGRMLCQKCNEREATVHYTNIINGMKVEVYLCQTCAQKEGDLFGQMEQMVLPAPLQQFISALLLSEAYHMMDTNQISMVTCPSCGLTYGQFVAQGKFQCANCYMTFQEALGPLFEKLHNKNKKHVGKIPKRSGETMILHKEILRRKQELKEMVAVENFEEAARLRDEIRALEALQYKKGGSENV